MPARDVLWDGGAADANFSSAENWDINGVDELPALGDNLIFDGTVSNKAGIVDAAFQVAVGDITFQGNYAGSITLNEDLSAATVSQLTGTVIISAGKNLEAENYQLTGGTISGPGTLILDAAAPTMTMSAGTFNGALNVVFVAAASVTISGNVNWTSVNFTSHGTTTWSGGNIFTNTGKFDNHGSFIITSDKTIFTPDTPNFEINNFATVQKNGGTGSTTIHAEFSNVHTAPAPLTSVKVNSGTLNLSGPGDHTVSMFAGVGTTINLNGTNIFFYNNSTIHGTGSVIVSGEVTIPQNHSLIANSPFRLEGSGRIEGPGAFSTSGPFEWTGGEFWQLSSLTNSGSMEIKGAAEKKITQSTLQNTGTVVWKDAGNIRANNAAIDNHGQFEVQNDQQITHDVGQSAAVVNRGTFTKTAGGAAPTVIDGFFENFDAGQFLLNGRTFHIKQGLRQTRNSSFTPLTNLGGGTLKVDANAWVEIDAGTLSGPGTIDGSLILDNATLDFGTAIGKLTITGDYEQTVNGKIKVKIAGTGANQFDVLEVQGSATLAGAVEVQLVNPFGPQQGDKFKFLTAAGGRTGTLTPPDDWTVNANPMDLTLVFSPQLPGGGG